VTGGGTSTADPGWRWPILLYGTVLVVLLLVSWQTIAQVVVNPKGVAGPVFAGDWFWGGWLRFDGGWYFFIAEQGYTYNEGVQSSVAFFPGYPLLMGGVARLVGNIGLGGILTTIACGWAAVCTYWRWCADRLPRREAVAALLALCLYPYAWYLYGAVYGDALFLLAAVGAFVLFERDHLVLAGLAGIVATSTRLVGVAIVVGLVVGVLEKRGAFSGTRWRVLPRSVDLRRLRRADAAVLLAPLGLVAWSAWLWHRFGDPLLFSSVQQYWGQPSTPRTWFKIDLLAALHGSPDRLYAYGCLLQGLLAFGVVLLIPAVIRRFGLRYGAYQAVLVAIPTFGSQDFQGTGRYLIAAFPAFAVVGPHLAGRPRLARVALPASAALLLLGTAWFAHGLYLS
jgi:hypothetical protein